MKFSNGILVLIFPLLLISCNRNIQVRNGNLLLEFNKNLQSRVNYCEQASKPLMSEYSASEYLLCKKIDAKLFPINKSSSEDFSDKLGKGKKTTLAGKFSQEGYSILKIIEIISYDSFPDIAFLNVKYINTGKKNIDVLGWVNNSYRVLGGESTPAFWSFQGSSTYERKDWILPVDSAFSQRNYLGMNNTDYGGGIPLLDLWRKDAGIAIGHAELIPEMISLPVEKDRYESSASIKVEYEYPVPQPFRVGDTLKTLRTFVSVHKGDCYTSLQQYSKFMQAAGIKLAPVEPDAYEAVWCAWGYERKFTVNEVLGTLSKVKELGLKWVDIDDGYQQAEGDWDVDRSKFPNGNSDMRKMVDKIHSMGLKVKLWWAPLAVDPGSQLLKNNPDIILKNQDGVPQFISYWDSYYMSPQYFKTIDHTKAVLKMFFKDWGFDGLKMDGGFLNCVPPDYNRRHKLAYPAQSAEKLPEFFEMIYNTATEMKAHAVLQICPCGTAMSFFNMPYTNQTVASDPTSSWQIRLKGKSYKALLGKAAYYGDHIELSDGANDFASQVGIGAVLGTKFTWPKDNPYAREGKFVLTPDHEKTWKKWIGIYNQNMLPEGNYLGNLYDIGFDIPEAHVIEKNDTLYYAFYNKDWDGVIELRGLANKQYEINDYVNDLSYGKISRTNPKLKVKFKGSLLLRAVPEK